jgi:hypothetical protein
VGRTAPHRSGAIRRDEGELEGWSCERRMIVTRALKPAPASTGGFRFMRAATATPSRRCGNSTWRLPNRWPRPSRPTPRPCKTGSVSPTRSSAERSWPAPRPRSRPAPTPAS